MANMTKGKVVIKPWAVTENEVIKNEVGLGETKDKGSIGEIKAK